MSQENVETGSPLAGFRALPEDQLCTWVPGGAPIPPDRLDALVWALTELAPGALSIGAAIFGRRESRWAPVAQRAGGF